MSELEVVTPNLVRTVTEYVFVFNSGLEQTFIVDEEAGDTIEDWNDYYRVTLVDKPNIIDPEIVIPGEIIRIYKATLAVELKRKRTKTLPTPEQLFELGKLMHKEVRTIQ